MRYLESAPLTFEEEESQLQKSAITSPDTD
jgi:hypothetical protein